MFAASDMEDYVHGALHFFNIKKSDISNIEIDTWM